MMIRSSCWRQFAWLLLWAPLVNAATQDTPIEAVLMGQALQAIAQRQEADGSWTATSMGPPQPVAYNDPERIRVTSGALLAFLVCGYLPDVDSCYRSIVDRGMNALLQGMDAHGCWSHNAIDQAWATEAIDACDIEDEAARYRKAANLATSCLIAETDALRNAGPRELHPIIMAYATAGNELDVNTSESRQDLLEASQVWWKMHHIGGDNPAVSRVLERSASAASGTSEDVSAELAGNLAHLGKGHGDDMLDLLCAHLATPGQMDNKRSLGSLSAAIQGMYMDSGGSTWTSWTQWLMRTLVARRRPDRLWDPDQPGPTSLPGRVGATAQVVLILERIYIGNAIRKDGR